MIIENTIKKLIKYSKELFFIVFMNFFVVNFSFAGDIIRLEISGQAVGLVDIELYDDLSPLHSERIKKLVREKKYDGVVFHRVIDKFMAQTGDVKHGNINDLRPNLVGMGGSNYPDLRQEFSSKPFERGIVGMARASDVDSANSQFFIMFASAPHLNGKYTVIGEVVKGMEVIAKIKRGDVRKNGLVSEPDYILKAQLMD